MVGIDADQGQSGQSMVTRVGFQRVLAEVRLDHVGLMLGREMSRVARSQHDWHQRLERCALLSDLVGRGGGSRCSDRRPCSLAAGRRGMMSAAALDILNSRMVEGMRHKAQRGELLNHPPMGYVRGPDGDSQWDPDAQAPRVMRRIFDVFEPQGRRHGWRRYLVTQDIRRPIRPHGGATRGQWTGGVPHA